MLDKLPIKTLIAVFIAVIVWAFVNSSGKSDDAVGTADQSQTDNLVSSIQPVSGADAAQAGVASGRIPTLTQRSVQAIDADKLADLHARFNTANRQLAEGQSERAANAFQSLIDDYPSIIEPYLNLASIYSSQAKLNEARGVLLKGFEANPKAGMLFDHLSEVHGALAAQSYQHALDTKSTTNTPALALARASTIVTSLDQQQEIAKLTQQLSAQQSQISSADQTARLQELEAQVEQLQQAADSTKAVQDNELNQAKSRIAELSQSLTQSQAAEREALARVVRAEQDSSGNVSALNEQLLESQAALMAANEKLKQTALLSTRAEQAERRIEELEADNERISSDLKLALASNIATPGDTNQPQKAIDLVKGWARAWSAQDVDAYVGHYASNYSSSSSLSRAQWIEQRQIRLTNKEFINVRLKDFIVKDLGQQFSVTFSQHYQSNTVDDTVTKRLVFHKRGDDWSSAKIVNERLISP